jgi:RNA polymerase sigma-70 factor (ECF subfamily)
VTVAPVTPQPELWAAVRALPERQRAAVVLRYVADLPEKDIGLVLGVARGTVAASLAHARKNLAGALVEEPEETRNA